MSQNNGTYRGMTFPPYQYHEYPKWIGDKLVNNEVEEAELLAGLEDSDDSTASTTHREHANPLRSENSGRGRRGTNSKR